MYKLIIRPILFLFSPETIHHIVFIVLRTLKLIPGAGYLVRALFYFDHKELKTTLFGIEFPNPVGLAAGLDKNADAYEMFGNMGFGFVEIGTVTPLPQPGNPKPRIFRLKRDKALINRMGFNNLGTGKVVKRLLHKKRRVIIGGNIGKNKLTPNSDAINDYLKAMTALHPYVDYFVINVSSPNTPNLRELQEKEPLTELLFALKKRNSEFSKPKPILLKIAPDISFAQIDDIIKIISKTELDGIVATNTTIERENLSYDKNIIEDWGAGGLSGTPLKSRSTEIISYISNKTDKSLPIIGVGGIMNASDAIEKLEAGASLIQVYTGFIYEGPSLIKEINKAILTKRKINE